MLLPVMLEMMLEIMLAFFLMSNFPEFNYSVSEHLKKHIYQESKIVDKTGFFDTIFSVCRQKDVR